jgi:hypothetical protein
LKKDISDANIDELSDILKTIQLKKFKFIDESMSENTFGLIADDLEVIPNLGEQTVRTAPGFLPNIYTPTTYEMLDEEKKVLLVTEIEEKVERKDIGEGGEGGGEPEYVTRRVGVVGKYMRIMMDNSSSSSTKLRRGDRIRFFTYRNDVIPTRPNVTDDNARDHQTLVYDSDDTSITVFNDNSLDNLNQNVFMYGTYTNDVKVLEDTNNISYCLIASTQKLLKEVEELEKETKEVEEIMVRNGLL